MRCGCDVCSKTCKHLLVERLNVIGIPPFRSDGASIPRDTFVPAFARVGATDVCQTARIVEYASIERPYGTRLNAVFSSTYAARMNLILSVLNQNIIIEQDRASISMP